MNAHAVKSTDQSLEATLEIAEKLRQEFIEDSVLFVRSWYKDTMNKFILTYPPAAEKLTDEHKRDIRRRIAILKNDVEAELIELLMRDKHWWHSGSITDIERDYYVTCDNLLDYDFRVIFGKLGLILEDYGFINKNFYDGDKGFLAHKDGSNRYYFEYLYPVYWSDAMKRTIDNYWENYKFYLDTLKK